jgi:hypothetical protein
LLRHARAPAVVAALACCHLSFAASVGGRSSCFTHRRVAETVAEPRSKMPADARTAPIPTSTPPALKSFLLELNSLLPPGPPPSPILVAGGTPGIILLG